MTQPNFDFENQYEGVIAGVDEAGCGPWAGPVVAVAVIIDQRLFPQHFIEKINDSKKLSKRQRENLYHQLVDHPCIDYCIANSSVEEIDQLNISQATQLAMRRAVTGLEVKPDHLLIDGVRDPRLDYASHLIVKGDQKSFSIATASIIAKVKRDEMMTHLHQDFPFFGWDKNAGYGTLIHRQGLQRYGVTPHHRRSFAPIRQLLETRSMD